MSIQHLSDEKYGRRPKRQFCSGECRLRGKQKWRDKKEQNREKKRRQRANRRARGLTVLGLPYKSEAHRLATAPRIMAPTNRAEGVLP